MKYLYLKRKNGDVIVLSGDVIIGPHTTTFYESFTGVVLMAIGKNTPFRVGTSTYFYYCKIPEMGGNYGEVFDSIEELYAKYFVELL